MYIKNAYLHVSNNVLDSCILETIRRSKRAINPIEAINELSHLSLDEWGENMEINWQYLANKLGVVSHDITNNLR